MGNSHLYFLISILFPLIFVPANAEKRTLICDKVCKGIRFPGKIGGCNCNYIMFTKRSSQLQSVRRILSEECAKGNETGTTAGTFGSRSMETEVENLEQLGKNLSGSADDDESREFEIQDERESMQPEISRNLIQLLRRKIISLIIRDIDY